MDRDSLQLQREAIVSVVGQCEPLPLKLEAAPNDKGAIWSGGYSRNVIVESQYIAECIDVANRPSYITHDAPLTDVEVQAELQKELAKCQQLKPGPIERKF